jgi:phosphopantetheinyl transferase
MAIFYQHNINQQTRLAIWKLDEPEAFFLQKVPLNKEVTHPHKRVQHLAGRYLLTQLFEDFPLEEIVIADTRKPFLENEAYHFSISHCGNFAAAIASSNQRVGIDIEMVDAKIERVASKFIHPTEMMFLQQLILKEPSLSDLTAKTILWSCKEAIFKWYGAGKVDFKNHMQWTGHFTTANSSMQLQFVFCKHQPLLLTLSAKKINTQIVSWLHS